MADPQQTRPLRLLSLDGGGVKGLTSLLILNEIFRAIEQENGTQGNVSNYFDLIGGTSTGGLIAIMLGRLGMTTEECIKHYKELSPEVFANTFSRRLGILSAVAGNAWFKGDNLKKEIIKLLESRGLEASEHLRDPDANHPKVFVCTTRVHTTTSELLRSYKTTTIGERNYDCFIWEAARATTAAPVFFDPVTLEKDGVTFTDGGIRDNNPINRVINEAELLWPGRPIGCVVSIGTGWKLIKPLETQKSKLHNILKTLSEITTDATETARAFLRSKEGRTLAKGGKYFRFAVEQGIDSVNLEEWEKAAWMESMTQPYLSDRADEILACSKNLLNPTDITSNEGAFQFVSTLPQYSNPLFTGRENVFREIESLFQMSDPLHQRVVLFGLSAIGKSQIALKAAEAAQAKSHVFWISADNNQAIETSMTKCLEVFAPQKDIPKDVRERAILFWNVLSSGAFGPWMVILDGADDKGAFLKGVHEETGLPAIKDWLPRSKDGRILITSTDSRLQGLAEGQVVQPSNGIHIVELSTEEGSSLIQKHLLPDQALRSGELDYAALVNRLGAFPLALTQAAAYIRETDIDAQDYLELIIQHESTALERLTDFPGISWNSNEQSVLTTFEMSYNRIGGALSPKSSAASLLNHLALLNSECIEYPIGEFIYSRIGEDLEYQRAFASTLSFSLMTRHPEGKFFSIHKLVAIWLIRRLGTDPISFGSCMENVASCLARVIPQDAEDRNYAPLANLFAPHANSLLKVAPDRVTRTTLTDEGYEAYIDVQYSFSRFLVLELEFDGALTAIEILQRSVYDQEEKPSEKTLARQLLLGVAYYETFESYLGKAMEQFRDCIQYASSMTEIYVARSCLYIAMIKSGQGDQAVEDAREMLRNVLCNENEDLWQILYTKNLLAETLRMNAFSMWSTPWLGCPGAKEAVSKMLSERMNRLRTGPERIGDEAELTKACMELCERLEYTASEIYLDCLGREVERNLSTDKRSALCMRSIEGRMDCRGPANLFFARRHQLGKAHPALQHELADKFCSSFRAFLEKLDPRELESPCWMVIQGDLCGQQGENLHWRGEFEAAEPYLRRALEIRQETSKIDAKLAPQEVLDINIDTLGIALIGQGSAKKFREFWEKYGTRVSKPALLPAPEDDLDSPWPRFYKSLRDAQLSMHELAKAGGPESCSWTMIPQDLDYLPECGPDTDPLGLVPKSVPWKLKFEVQEPLSTSHLLTSASLSAERDLETKDSANPTPSSGSSIASTATSSDYSETASGSMIEVMISSRLGPVQLADRSYSDKP